MDPTPVNRSLPAPNTGTIQGPPTASSKDQGTRPHLETANANAVNVANVVSVIRIVDAATGIRNPIPSTYLLPTPIPTLPSRPAPKKSL